jgi:hypothetical protein
MYNMTTSALVRESLQARRAPSDLATPGHVMPDKVLDVAEEVLKEGGPNQQATRVAIHALNWRAAKLSRTHAVALCIFQLLGLRNWPCANKLQLDDTPSWLVTRCQRTGLSRTASLFAGSPSATTLQ